MKEVNDFRESKVGDDVYSLINGHGVIVDILDYDDYPIVVNFDNYDKGSQINNRSYSLDGKYYDDTVFPELYRTQPTVTAPPPKKKVKVKTYVVFFKAPLNGNDIESTSFDKDDKYREFISRPYLTVLGTEIIEKEF